jgi:hypothetical protein
MPDPEITPRFVTNGRLEGEIYVITLDGTEEVETEDQATAQVAARSRSPKRPVEVVLEAQGAGRRPRIVELRALPAPEPPASTAVAKPSSPGQTAIAKAPDLPRGIISNPEVLTQQLRAMEHYYNVLSPAIALSDVTPGFGASFALITVNTAVNDKGKGTDTYRSAKIHAPDERGLSKTCLLRLSQAAGIQWLESGCKPLPTYGERNLWRWKHFGYIRTHDGQWQPIHGSKELDLRDGSDEIADMKPAQIQQARSFGNEICETKSMERAIRMALAIRQSYTVAELAKPFAIVRFNFTPDMNDPEIKKIVTEANLKGIGALYQPPPTAALPEHLDDPLGDAMPTIDDGDVKPAKESRSSVKRAAQQSRKADPFAAATVDNGFRTIADVKVIKEGNNAAGRPWKMIRVIADTGESWTTFSLTDAAVANEAKAKGWPVRITDKENEKYPDQRDLESITLIDPRQPNLPGTDAPAGGL